MYSGYGITIDSAGSWRFDNVIARNVIIFDVDNGSSSHADNRKNNFLVLCECPTIELNGKLGSPEKKFSINFSKASTKYCAFHCNDGNSFLFVNGKEIFNFKTDDKNVNFQTQFCPTHV